MTKTSVNFFLGSVAGEYNGSSRRRTNIKAILEKHEKSIEIKALCENSNVFLNTVPGKNGQKMELSLPFQSSVPATFIKLMKQNSFKFADGSVDYLGNTLYNFQP